MCVIHVWVPVEASGVESFATRITCKIWVPVEARGVESLAARFTGRCELLDIGVSNQMCRLLQKQYTLNH